MIKKGFVIGIILIFLGNTFVVSSEIIDTKEMQNYANENIIEIRVAIHSELSEWSGFRDILEDYQWMVGNKTYEMSLFYLTDNDIFNGKLTTENFDLLAMPYNEEIMELARRFYPSKSNSMWKTRITDYVKSGGGFVGYCAPALMTSEIYGKPKTLFSMIIDNFNFEISGVKLIFDNGLPFLSQLSGKPEAIGASAYLFYSGNYIPLDVTINRNNPIFNDFLEDKRRISWCAGPGFVIPNGTNHNITALAYFPEEEISDIESTQIYAWKYTGGIRGFIKGSIKSRREGIGGGFLIFPFLKCAEDWELQIR